MRSSVLMYVGNSLYVIYNVRGRGQLAESVIPYDLSMAKLFNVVSHVDVRRFCTLFVMCVSVESLQKIIS